MTDAKADSLARAETLVPRWLPDGKRVHSEWVARNPTRADTHIGSFKVNLRTGRWADFATGEKGGNLVSLLAYLRGCEWKEAACAIDDEVRVVPRDPVITRKVMMWVPLRVGVGVPSFKHYRLGEPTRVWRYDNADSTVQGYVCRFDTPDGKEVLPLTYCQRDDGNRDWRWKAMGVPRPLYNLPEVVARRDAPVLIVEGEKAADAARRMLPCFVVTTWAGGCKALDLADLSPLEGRRVIALPDNDEPGKEAMAKVVAKVGGRLVTLPANLPKGWDAADAEADGWLPSRLLRLVQ